MLKNLLESIFQEQDELPNSFSLAMGELIRKARVEAKMSQSDLAMGYFRQSSISQIESGKRSVSAIDLVYFSQALNKPILYFFPLEIFGVKQIEHHGLTILEQELLAQSRRLGNNDLEKLVAIARALADVHEDLDFLDSK